MLHDAKYMLFLLTLVSFIYNKLQDIRVDIIIMNTKLNEVENNAK